MINSFNDIEQMATHLRYILQEAPKRLQANLEEVTTCDKEIRDIEHVLELTIFNAAEGFNYSRDIQKARRRRRELKDEIELLSPLVEAIKNLKVNQNELNKSLGEIRKVKQSHERRTYRMRVRTDLQPVIDRQKLKVVAK